MRDEVMVASQGRPAGEARPHFLPAYNALAATTEDQVIVAAERTVVPASFCGAVVRPL